MCDQAITTAAVSGTTSINTATRRAAPTTATRNCVFIGAIQDPMPRGVKHGLAGASATIERGAPLPCDLENSTAASEGPFQFAVFSFMRWQRKPKTPKRQRPKTSGSGMAVALMANWPQENCT